MSGVTAPRSLTIFENVLRDTFKLAATIDTVIWSGSR